MDNNPLALYAYAERRGIEVDWVSMRRASSLSAPLPDGSLWPLPNNPAYDPQHYSPAEIATLPVRIIGKVVELRGKF